MPWTVIQIKEKKGKKFSRRIEAVPETWLKHGFVCWPTKNQVTRQQNEYDPIDLDESTPYQCIMMQKNIRSFEVADRKANSLKPVISDVENGSNKLKVKQATLPPETMPPENMPPANPPTWRIDESDSMQLQVNYTVTNSFKSAILYYFLIQGNTKFSTVIGVRCAQ